ncbi:MAG: hydantoinase/oxoprolinase family protein [Candidatus Promineofilum sp.]|nr:hydantoinase/oxoprolinase family protein [Promineifilum sp.]
MGYSLAIDTGGTHTDLVLVATEGEHVWAIKVPTTPTAPLQGILNGIARITMLAGIDPVEIDELVYGTTIVTNMLVQQESVALGLITTRGFRDVLEIGRAYRTGNIYDIQMERRPPLVERALRLEVDERVNFRGEVLTSLDEAGCRAVVRSLRARGSNSIAVSLLHSYINPEHELRVRDIIAEEHPTAHVSLSSEVNPVFREYERTSTTVVNAYVMPRMVDHLDEFTERMNERGVTSRLYTMQANGGRASFIMARKQPVNITNSGPVAGVIAGSHIARLAGFRNVITLDMGGTSCDVGLIENGEPKFALESEVAGYPVQIKTVDLRIVGAGGGSIAWIDQGGGLRVGPQSAGADPGPVCYGKGGRQPTVTDAHVVTGRIDPHYFLGGDVHLDVESARAAIEEQIARPLKMDVLEAALGIIRVANAVMIRGIKLITVERGLDPRDFALMAFGGAGPLHAAQLAEELEIPVVIVPRFPGNTSALGLAISDVQHDNVMTRIQNIKDTRIDEMEGVFLQLEAQADLQLEQEDIAADRRRLIRSCDMRYFGQAYELGVPVDETLTSQDSLLRLSSAFHALHRRTYGHAMEGDPVEVVNYRVTATGLKDKPELWVQPDQDVRASARKGRREVFFEPGCLLADVYERRRLTAGDTLQGPVIIEQLGSTTILQPGQVARMDGYGNLIMTIVERETTNS